MLRDFTIFPASEAEHQQPFLPVIIFFCSQEICESRRSIQIFLFVGIFSLYHQLSFTHYYYTIFSIITFHTRSTTISSTAPIPYACHHFPPTKGRKEIMKILISSQIKNALMGDDEIQIFAVVVAKKYLCTSTRRHVT